MKTSSKSSATVLTFWLCSRAPMPVTARGTFPVSQMTSSALWTPMSMSRPGLLYPFGRAVRVLEDGDDLEDLADAPFGQQLPCAQQRRVEAAHEGEHQRLPAPLVPVEPGDEFARRFQRVGERLLQQHPLAGVDQGSGFPEVVGGAGGDHRGVGNPGLRQLVDRREGPDFRLLPRLQLRGDAPGEVLVAVDDGGQLAGPLPVGELLNVQGVEDADAADADGGDFEGSGHVRLSGSTSRKGAPGGLLPRRRSPRAR